MAVTGNICTEIGDVMVLKASVPILGLSAINSFTDIIVGGTGTKYFSKEFRYTLDGINWSDWEALTNGNLQAVGVDPKHIFKIEYKYQRAGSDATGNLELTSVEIDGDYTDLTTPDIYWNGVFGKFFELYNLDSLEWARNVLEKIYRDGILPKYIERNVENNQNWEDKDFIDFWFSITHFLSLFVKYSRVFQDFYIDESLLIQYLESKGMYLSKDMNYDELYYIMGDYFEQIRYRGTPQVAKIKDAEIYVNGELLRLINKFTYDEFVFALVERNKSIWNVNRCSPLYTGIGGIRNSIKGYETTDEVISKTLYPLLNGTNVTIVDSGGVDVLKFVGPLSTPTGIGSVAWDSTKAIIIDPNLNYEISCWLHQDILSNNLYFGVKTYDKYGNSVPVYNIDDFSNQDGYFLEGTQVNKTNTWYFVQGILYNKSEAQRTDNYKLNIGLGQNLRLDKRTYHIIPFLYTNDASVANLEVKVKNFIVKPVSTSFQRNFIGVPNLIITFMKNRSGRYSNSQIEDVMRKYLLPYGSVVLNDWI